MSAPVLRLLGDIGGTNVRLALQAPGGAPQEIESLPTAGAASLEDLIGGYLSRHAERGRPVAMALAVAAPIEGDRVRMTNIEWEISTPGLRSALGVEHVLLLNDFAAIALAIPALARADLETVGPELPPRRGTIGVLGPGTGLGVAGLVPVADGWLALPSEGGHVSLAPESEQEWGAVRWLHARFGHASAERALSGPGLVNLYHALGGEGALAPSQVVAAAEAGEPHAREALEMFFALLGTIAGNLALTLGARGGVYLAGGILPRMAAQLRASRFRDRFEAKGRFRDYLAGIATRLVIHPLPAFLGLALHLDQKLGEEA